ncbi:ribosomal RNA-processing protein 17 [Colletotrichum spaethianum]|uniref:Ribosomal RNA-processing protein 17 n=1 Tax=Colletotrichum spaethianum TaxID=700344 RepID=A0AA37LBF8_9PEZI|nr:ribosomal RNA-processing protein 17 [Colletotrichum spaethianum]GKT41277.1 ribosomal RNA-processing protein 17 [Colletotrichum spaethianum]
MAGTETKKRTNDGRLAPPSKKQKRQDKKQAEPASDEEQSFDAVNLLDSDDDDILNANVDDGAVSDDNDSASSADERPTPRKTTKPAPKAKKSRDAPVGTDSDSDSEEESADDHEGAPQKTKSKRNDPSAFSTSMSKILSTKLSNAKRADPVLARSAEAHESAKAAVDLALESKARKQMRQQKKEAMERGRVRNVLVAPETEDTSTGEMIETERRLRKVAQRGVVKLFNAVRAAQVKAAEAEKKARKDGVVGVVRREEKINEMSKKGFLDLIASGGGGLKKGALEEA